MAFTIADNIISPLGDSSEANWLAVKEGLSALKACRGDDFGVKEDFTAGIMEWPSETSRFEEKILTSVRKALEGLELPSDKTILILSSTKGSEGDIGGCRAMGESAGEIARTLGLDTEPVVVSNACISGLAAIILASRLLDQGFYDYAIVCGTDDIGPFVISGFQSLKAMSSSPCRPFDMERIGLNLGEAVGTVILSSHKTSTHSHFWQISGGVVRNDAFNLTSPSKTAEGQYRCLTELLEDFKPDAISLHGTATFFNDQMESVAIKRAGLSDVPASALKGYFGHTLGAAGIIETIISMKAADESIVLGTKGFSCLGVSGKVNLSSDNRSVKTDSFVKMLSGFGGCNACVLFENNDDVARAEAEFRPYTIMHRIIVKPGYVAVDGREIDAEGGLVGLYKRYVGDYPKFHKMDGLSKLGFIASELLLKEEAKCDGAGGSRVPPLHEKQNTEATDTCVGEGSCPLPISESRAVILFNKLSSLSADREYLKSMEEGYPSPSVFIYTLPNIVTGEIAIRNGWHGETSMYVLREHNPELEEQILMATFRDGAIESILGGWIDYADENDYLAEFQILKAEY